MGGILGKLSFERDEMPARAVLEQMLGVLQHGQQTPTALHIGRGIALAWCGAPDARASREAVVSNSFRTARVVADSTLTNAGELRAALERRGHHFRTPTDAEVMAHAYDAWGDRAVERFRGPFACAIWDEYRSRLLVARDRIGIRPLYFALLHGRCVVFASEARALLQDPGVGRECCPEAIDAYLALGYVPAPLSAYRRVSKLQPAQRLVVEGRRLHVEQYWDLPSPAAATYADVAAETAERLRRATAECRGDGEAATLYSGGAASAALLAVTPAAHTRSVTAALGGEHDEAAHGRQAARLLGHDPAIARVSLDMPDVAIRFASHLDEPIADPAAVCQHAICTVVSRHASSVVSGHGASTLWAGAVSRYPAGLALGSAPPRGHLTRSARDLPWRPTGTAHAAVAAAGVCPVGHVAGLWDDDRRRALYTPGFAWQVREANPLARHVELYIARDSADPEDRAIYVEARTCLPDSTLATVERSAAAAGLSFRFPYLQHDVVELAALVPPAMKQSDAGMRPLRDLLARRLPPEFVPPPWRPAAHAWLPGALATLAPAVLLAPRFDGRGIVSRAALRHIWDEHRSGACNHTRRLWALLMLELWLRSVIDGEAIAAPAGSLLPRAA